MKISLLSILIFALACSAMAATTCSTQTGGPACPGGFGIVCVNLSWTASTSQVDGYNLYRGTTSGGENTQTPINTSLITGTSFQDNAVSAGTAYYYLAVAMKGGQSSAASNEACAQTPVVPAPPSAFAANPQ